MVILAIDALEYSLVEEFDCKNLKQRFYGKTDIKEFKEPMTMVLWSSFMTGKNMEREILKKKDIWSTEISFEDTFFVSFDNPKIIDLPGYNYDKVQHKKERELLNKYFDKEVNLKNLIKMEYNNIAFAHYRKIKQEFEKSLENNNYDFILGYFSIADVVGHLNFGNKVMMKMIYNDLDDLAKKIKNSYVVLSDHGMEQIGMYGDHSRYGFWSTNFKDLGSPRITDFAKILF